MENRHTKARCCIFAYFRVADPVGFDPDPVGFDPDPVGFDPDPVGFVPDPVGFDPDPDPTLDKKVSITDTYDISILYYITLE